MFIFLVCIVKLYNANSTCHAMRVRLFYLTTSTAKFMHRSW